MSFFDMFRKKRLEAEVDFDNLPVHVAIIMDGNGRWAKRRSLPRKSGHAMGAKTFEEISECAGELGIKIVNFYAFSTENWKRDKEEVEALMALLEDYLDNGLQKLKGRARIRFLGDMSAFSESFREKQRYIEEATKDNSGFLINVALNYGSRDEITRAVRGIAEDVRSGKISAADITEEFISSRLDTGTEPDPDLIIRPSGEYRLSNFLMWQGAYSELWFDKILWPDFKKEGLLRAIHDYQNRNRRFGGR